MATCAYLSYKMLNIKPENQEKHKEKRQIYTWRFYHFYYCFYFSCKWTQISVMNSLQDSPAWISSNPYLEKKR